MSWCRETSRLRAVDFGTGRLPTTKDCVAICRSEGIGLRLIGLIIGVLAFVTACGDDSVHRPNSKEYEDPESFYTPPQRQQAAAKADLLSPNPFIRRVSWAPSGTCELGTFAPMRIKLHIDDQDSEVEELKIEGTISGCDSEMSRFGPTITGPDVLVDCHHVREHKGFVTVVDEEGRGDSVIFKFGPCEQGEAVYLD